jgi:hypothetical protein
MPRLARPLAPVTGAVARTAARTVARTAARTAARTLGGALAALLAACGGDTIAGVDVPSAQLGSFDGNASGAVSLGIKGVALYGQLSAQAGQAGFQLAMGSLAADSTFANMVVLSREKRDVPGAGTYAIYDLEGDDAPPADAFSLVSVLQRTGSQQTVCVARSGTLTVSSAGGGRVKGSYTAQASCVATADPGRAAAATLSGSFEAVEGSKLVRLPGSARPADGARLTLGASR